MTHVSLELQSKDGNREIHKQNISNINPAATDSQLAQVGRALVGLTTNTYVDTIRVERRSMNESLG